MQQEQVIQRITELGREILPEGVSLWLYGSRARGDMVIPVAHPGLYLVQTGTATHKVLTR